MPNPATIGSGLDYATANLWWATEASIDYGVPIRGLCAPGENVGTGFNPSGTTPNGAILGTNAIEFDGSNDSQLAIINRVSVSAVITLQDLRIITNNQFVDPFVTNAASNGSVFQRLIIEDETGSNTDVVRTAGNTPDSILRNSIIMSGQKGIDFGFNFQLPTQNITQFGASGNGYEGLGNNGNHSNIFAFNNGGNDYASMNNHYIQRLRR